jgi:glycosyltransferase involved in cell wall biosynthesis
MQVLVPYMARLHGVRRLVATVHNPVEKKSTAKIIGYRRYDFVLSTSKMVEASLKSAGISDEKVFTHYLGVHDIPERSLQERRRWREKLDLPMESIVFGCIAFDARFKGNDVLMEGFAHVLAEHRDVYLLNIGVDPENSELPERAQRLGISSHVRWAGIVDEGWRLLNAVDIYVQPSRGEAFALSVAEALSMKLPVIVTDTTGASEVLKHGEDAIIVEPQSPEALSTAMRYLIRHEAKRKELGEAGFSVARSCLRAKESAKQIVDKYY